jgi:4-methylaminobutanoate oxidase (formaldehyde-forming)
MGYVAHADGVDAAFVSAGRWELEIAIERFPATARLDPPYDATSARVRG